MAIRVLNKLTAREAASAGDGRHGDGGGLYLRVTNSGRSRSWIFRYTGGDGRVVEIGLGRAGQDGVSLKAARYERDRLIGQRRDGIDPLAERRRKEREEQGKRSFAEVAAMVVANRRDTWRGTSSAKSWARTISVIAAPIADLPVADITIEDVERCVAPMWKAGNHPAAKLALKRLEIVFGFARAKRWRTSDNPAAWDDLFEHIAPRAKGAKRHHPAITWDDAAPTEIAALFASLGRTRRKAMSNPTLMFAALTATRISEARMAQWSEIEFDKALWTVPGERMKRALPHVVPLSDRAVEILRACEAQRRRSLYVFARANGRPPSRQSIWRGAERASGGRQSPHGWRASFRSWAADQEWIASEVAELCLAHVGGPLRQAYQRSEMIERRRKVMAAWADFLEGKGGAAADNVLDLSTRRA
jgi:integrase